MASKFDLRATVLENSCLGGKYYRIRVFAPQIAAIAQPGQFCMIRPEFSGESLLRRPFSIAAVRKQDELEFAYTAIGRGTRLLAQLQPGQIMLCLGPLGNSFPIPQGGDAIVVAGGIGMAPFPFLNRVLKEHGVRPTTYYGARKAEELIYLDELEELSKRVVLATDDGSHGFHGFITDALEKDLKQYDNKTLLFACGPHPMLRRVKILAEQFRIRAYLSMEEIMGCGIGICIGCPIPGVTPEGQDIYYLCCREGPIFDSAMVRL